MVEVGFGLELSCCKAAQSDAGRNVAAGSALSNVRRFTAGILTDDDAMPGSCCRRQRQEIGTESSRDSTKLVPELRQTIPLGWSGVRNPGVSSRKNAFLFAEGWPRMISALTPASPRHSISKAP